MLSATSTIDSVNELCADFTLVPAPPSPELPTPPGTEQQIIDFKSIVQATQTRLRRILDDLCNYHASGHTECRSVTLVLTPQALTTLLGWYPEALETPLEQVLFDLLQWLDTETISPLSLDFVDQITLLARNIATTYEQSLM